MGNGYFANIKKEVHVKCREDIENLVGIFLMQDTLIFLRIIDCMLYIIELDFEGGKLVDKHEHCYVEKEFRGNQRADKRL